MPKKFATFSEFKRIIQVGDKLHTMYHMNIIGRDENQKVIYGDKDMGVREVSIKQSNAIACKTPKSDGTFSDSWLHWPKASETKIVNNDTLEVYEKDTRQFPGGLMSPGNPDYDNLPTIKILTYKFVD